MRILHVSDVYLPRLGGIEMHVHDLADQQRRRGHDVQVVSATPAAPGQPPDPAWVHRVSHSWSSVPHPVGLGRQTISLLTWADVVHVHVSVISPFAFDVARLAASLGCPTLVTVHSLWSALGALPVLAGTCSGMRSWQVQWSAVSQAAAEPVRRVVGPGRDVLVLPNAVDVADWRLEPDGDGDGDGDRDRDRDATIITVMRLARTKRPIPLLRMLREIRTALPASRPLRAVIIGDGPLRPAVERYVARHGLADWVELRGRLDRVAIRQELARASIYVAPAELESFGIAALEARAAGLPVVASSHGGVGTFITHGVDGLLGATDAALVSQVLRLLVDDRLAHRIRSHNRLVAPPFDWSSACGDAQRAYDAAARVARPSGSLALRVRQGAP